MNQMSRQSLRSSDYYTSKYNTVEEPIQQRVSTKQIQNIYEKKKFFESAILPKKDHIDMGMEYWQKFMKQQNLEGKFKEHYKMSKQECEALLFEIKDELGESKQKIDNYYKETVDYINKAFDNELDKIKGVLIDLVNDAFEKHRSVVEREISRMRKCEPKEFSDVRFYIQTIEEEIDLNLRKLRGNDHRKTIADMVLRDFEGEMRTINEGIYKSKIKYFENIEFLEADQSILDSIKVDLGNLFCFTKANALMLQKSFVSRPNQSRIQSMRDLKVSTADYETVNSSPNPKRRTYYMAQ